MKESEFFFVLKFSTVFHYNGTDMFLQTGYQLQMLYNPNIHTNTTNPLLKKQENGFESLFHFCSGAVSFPLQTVLEISSRLGQPKSISGNHF